GRHRPSQQRWLEVGALERRRERRDDGARDPAGQRRSRLRAAGGENPMNALLSSSLSFVLVLATSAQNTPAPSDAMSQVSSAAQAELAKSTAALNQLRDQIGAEKLPLAQELTKLEEQLSALRREHDQVTRAVDEGNL